MLEDGTSERLVAGDSECDECGERIPKRRREALPGVRTRVACQATLCLLHGESSPPGA